MCKKFEGVSVNDLHLHEIYKLYIRLRTLAHITLVLTQHFHAQFVEPGEGIAKPHTCERRV